MISHRGLDFPEHRWEEEVTGYLLLYGNNLEREFASFLFSYRTGQRVLVWINGAFYTLSDVLCDISYHRNMSNAHELDLLRWELMRCVHRQFEQWQQLFE